MRITILLISLLALFIHCSNGKSETLYSNQPSANKEIVCFVYHRFGDDRFPSTNVSLTNFEAHLKYLVENDFQVLTFGEAIDYLKSTDPEQKTAVITIDDGYKTFYENGLPLLEKYSFKATLFINTETIGGADYLDWSELKDASNRGVEIGNHTHSHDYFLNLAEVNRYKVFEEELKTSQGLIEKHLGVIPKTFAYPYGELDAKMKEIVRSSGFKAATAQNSGVICNGTDLMRCPRFPMSESYADPEKFALKARMKALKVTSETPGSFIVPGDGSKPTLTLEFKKENLLTDQLQCFIQGSDCQKDLIYEEDGQIKLTLRATTSIMGKRRTLYTITVPDQDGHWHWFSHLWINPSEK